MMARVFDLMLAEVHRYEGTVNQFLGDGIMALFGAPIAHEDSRAARRAGGARHPEGARGVRGRASPPRRASPSGSRQGLNTGPGGRRQHRQRPAHGLHGGRRHDQRRRAAATGGRARTRPHLRGDPPARLAATSSARAPRRARRSRGRPSPFAPGTWCRARAVDGRGSRSRPTAASRRWSGASASSGSSRRPSSGPRRAAGRSCSSSASRASASRACSTSFAGRVGDRATWLEGHCLSFGQAIAFHPSIDLLKRRFGSRRATPTRRSPRRSTRASCGSATICGPIVPYLQSLLSVDPGDPAVRAWIPELRRGGDLRRRSAAPRPGRRAAPPDRSSSRTCTGSTRPARSSSSPGGRRADVPGAARAHLPAGLPPALRRADATSHAHRARRRCRPQDSARMARAVLATRGLPGRARRADRQQGRGQPVLRRGAGQVAGGVGRARAAGTAATCWPGASTDIVVPDTIQDVIMARIDRLAEAPKKTLQLASVIGREFTRRSARPPRGG